MKTLMLLCLLNSSALAATDYLQAGLAQEHPAGNVGTQVRFIEAGRHLTGTTFDRQMSFGVWTDKSHYPGVRDSGFVQYSIGVEPRDGKVYVNYFLGPALITNKDSLLGSHFEFSNEIGIGVRDGRGVRLGLVFRHFSDAGLTSINEGRNWLCLRAEF